MGDAETKQQNETLSVLGSALQCSVMQWKQIPGVNEISPRHYSPEGSVFNGPPSHFLPIFFPPKIHLNFH